ncbi:MAG: ThiF family adenylyltransferase [Prevotella sp.]|nr:ThiF family adenylyltransferase [Prevotella sp.]MBR6945891.1 ThiF family adenylyltransferase [Prevotella sp.]
MEKEKYEWGEGVYTLLSWFKKDKVKNARVLVAGCGALGNEVVKNLALFGIGHIYVVDFDRIELSNLTRSVLFREEDAYNHSYKAEIVAKRAREINPQIEVTPIVGNLFSEVGFGIYRSVDVIIGCLDSRIARYQLNRLAMRAGKNWIDGSIENMTGAVKVYAPGISCYECSLSRDEFNHIMLRTGCADVVRSQTSQGRVATTPISASIVGALQVQEAMKIIHMDTTAEEENSEVTTFTPFKTLQGKMLRYEGMTNTMNIYKISSWKKICPAHEQWNNVIPCAELSATQFVEDVLTKLKSILKAENVEINMCNNKFIDIVATDYPQKEFEVMLPESQLEGFIKKNKELRQLSYRTLIHKHFFENIDDRFPYQQLTLKQIGIPLYDVLKVSTENGVFYVELSADAY